MAKKNPNNEYYHLLFHVLMHLGDLQRRLEKKHYDPSLNPELTKLEVNELSRDSLKLLHAIEPCITFAKKHLPEFDPFLVSCTKAIAKIKKDYGIAESDCDCKGCANKLS